MELRDYLHILGRRWMTWVTLMIIGAVGLGWYASAQPDQYNGIVTLSIFKKQEQLPSVYRYDNYYTLQANDLISKSIAGWAADPVVVSDIYQKAKVDLPATSLSRYGKLIKLSDLSGATVELQTTAPNAADAEKLAQAAGQYITNRLQDLSTSNTIDHVTVLQSRTMSEVVKTSVAIYALVGLVAGLVFGMVIAFWAEYLQPKKH